MNEDQSPSWVWRLHKDLWEKNRQTLAFQMEEARVKLLELERVKLEDKPVGLLVQSIVPELIAVEA